VAVAGRDQVDRDRLAELAAPRHREDLPDRRPRQGKGPRHVRARPAASSVSHRYPAARPRDGRKTRCAAWPWRRLSEA